MSIFGVSLQDISFMPGCDKNKPEWESLVKDFSKVNTKFSSSLDEAREVGGSGAYSMAISISPMYFKNDVTPVDQEHYNYHKQNGLEIELRENLNVSCGSVGKTVLYDLNVESGTIQKSYYHMEKGKPVRSGSYKMTLEYGQEGYLKLLKEFLDTADRLIFSVSDRAGFQDPGKKFYAKILGKIQENYNLLHPRVDGDKARGVNYKKI